MDHTLNEPAASTALSAPAGGSRLHVLFLVRSFGFPEGMAATNRVRLLGRSLIEQGACVRVMCTRVSERPGEERNRRISGTVDGIAFLYAPGTTVRSDSFLARRCREARGSVRALHELARLRRRGELDCVYLAAIPEGWRPSVRLLLRWLGHLGVPVVAELNELPGEVEWLPASIHGLPKWLSPSFSHLDGVSGAVAISKWLAEWTTAEATRIARAIPVLEVPIVVDAGVQQLTPYPQGGPPTFVYSASSEYGRAVTLILKAMQRVWRRYPDCRLVVTGMNPDTVAGLVAGEGLQAAVDDGRVAGVGYVDRTRLLELYRDASALVIPLFDDLRSRARFPTKIGEYLVSARPVVTTSVGEIERFFHDGETAYVCPPGDAAALGAKLIDVLNDPQRAAAVGAAGRRLAEAAFQYSLQGPRLLDFIERLARPGGVGLSASKNDLAPRPETTT